MWELSLTRSGEPDALRCEAVVFGVFLFEESRWTRSSPLACGESLAWVRATRAEQRNLAFF